MISYLAALLAAVTNATSNAVNRKAAREAPGRDQFRLRLIFDLLHRRAWLAAISLMCLSSVFSAVASGVFVFGEPIRTGPVLVLLVLPAAALVAGAVALIRSPRLQALQAAEIGPGSGRAVPQQRRDGPVKAVGHR